MPNRPPGVYDRLPADAAAARTVSAELTRTLARFGYQPIETPLIEYADLFLTKSGDEAINRLFTFELYGRQLCLRPEFTASAARLYVERFQHDARPIRWQMVGPVFRYETPQHNHSRQFTMLGAELIGASGAAGDAETMGAAARGLLAVGLRDWTLTVGHVGLVGQVLDRFELDRRTRRFMLGQIENLRRPNRGRAYVEAQFEQLYAMLPQPLEQQLEQASGAIIDHADMTHALQLLLESANLGTTGTGRTNEDVARRLLTKQQRATQRGQVSAALDFLEHFTAIDATPAEAFAAIDALLPDDPALRETAHNFRAAVDLLSAYEVPPEQVRVQMGLARGLNYYTGIVFEIYADSANSANGGGQITDDDSDQGDQQGDQLCGGGRYDDLIRVLGAAHSVPAIGFAYGIERIMHEMQRPAPETGVQALVVPIADADNAAAAHIAMRLRETWAVELYTPLMGTLSQALAYADKQAIRYVFIVGEAERAADSVTIRTMDSGAQTMYTLADLPALMTQLDHKEALSLSTTVG